MSEAFTGSCLCGAISYTGLGRPEIGGHCHCLDCRKTSGTGHASHAVMPAQAVEIKGNPSRYDKPADSGNMVSRYFCPTCGGQVYATNSGMPGMIYLRASSLDDPEVFSATLIVYRRGAPTWDLMDPDLPAFETMPPASQMPV